ncbi:MAG: hypothetical protein ACE5HI_03530 [bacterium]
MKRTFLTGLLLGFIISPGMLQAQWAVGPHIVVSFPSSDFANVSGTGGGFGIKVIRQVNTLGGIALRGDFAFLTYEKGFDTVRDAFNREFLAEIRNEAFRLTFGPNYTVGSRNFKVHFGAMGGFYFFRTNINVSTSFGFFQDSRDNEVALGWNVGGGFQYDIGLGPWLDVALRYQSIYNVPTTVTTQDTGGQVDTRKVDITAHELTLKIGLIFFLGK